jgi:hypothetical protein
MNKFQQDLAKMKFELRNAQIWIDKAIITSIDLEDRAFDEKNYLIDAIKGNDYDLRKYLTKEESYV